MPKVIFNVVPPTSVAPDERLKYVCTADSDGVHYTDDQLQQHVTDHHPGHFYIVDTSNVNW